MNTGEINKLIAKEEIKNLRIRYAHYLDSNNLAALAELFTTDAICQTDRTPWRGREEIREGLTIAVADYDKHNHGNYPFMHAIMNQWVELTGENTAEGRCYLIDLVTQRPIEESTLLLLGVYADEYKFIEGKWYISRSRLDLIWPQRNIAGGYPGDNLVLPE